MQARHKRHQQMGSHHKDGGRVPGHIYRARGGRAGESGGANSSAQGQAYGKSEPVLDHGNPPVVAAAKSKKSIGKVDGIYSKARLDRKSRG